MLSRSHFQFQTEAGAGHSKPTPGQEWLAAFGLHFPVLVLVPVVVLVVLVVVVVVVVVVAAATTAAVAVVVVLE